MTAVDASPYRTAPLPRSHPHDEEARVLVVARWGDEVLAVEHLARGERFTLSPTMTREPFALVHPSVEVALVGAEHRADGACYAHGHADPLVDDTPAFVTIGVITLDVRRVWMPAPLPPPQPDPHLRRALACVTALVVMAWVAVAVAAREDTQLAQDARDETLHALVARWPDAASVTHASPPPPSPWLWRWHQYDCTQRGVTCYFGPCRPHPNAAVCEELGRQRDNQPSWLDWGPLPSPPPPAPNVSCKVRYDTKWVAQPTDVRPPGHLLYVEEYLREWRDRGASLRWRRRGGTLDLRWRPGGHAVDLDVSGIAPGVRGLRNRAVTESRCRYWDLPRARSASPDGTTRDPSR